WHLREAYRDGKNSWNAGARNPEPIQPSRPWGDLKLLSMNPRRTQAAQLRKPPAMKGIKRLLIGLVTVVGMAAFADTKLTTSSPSENRLEALFKADLQYRSESQSDAVVVAEGRDGVYIGSGDGTVVGDRLRGTIRWSLWSGNCLYPMVRSGQSVP